MYIISAKIFVAEFKFVITVIAEILRKSCRTTFWRTPRRTSCELCNVQLPFFSDKKNCEKQPSDNCSPLRENDAKTLRRKPRCVL